MEHSNTILNQIITLFSRHAFEKLAKTHHVGQKFRSFNRCKILGVRFCDIIFMFRKASPDFSPAKMITYSRSTPVNYSSRFLLG